MTKGNYNWDAELFRILPEVSKVSNYDQLNTILLKWIDKLGVVDSCVGCVKTPKGSVKMFATHGRLLSGKILSDKVKHKLQFIIDNADIKSSHFVQAAKGTGNAYFDNEEDYAQLNYPDVGFRILCLYRYWAVINYFYPYKYLIKPDWSSIIKDFLPEFIKVKNEQEYVLCVLKLIGSIKDTHANIWVESKALESFKGDLRLPIEAKFIEKNLVVISLRNLKSPLKVGDVIVKINGSRVKDLVKRFMPYVPASNYSTQLRDMPNNFLLRTNSKLNKLECLRNGQRKFINIEALPKDLVKPVYTNRNVCDTLLDDRIGYIFAGNYSNTNLDSIKRKFANSPGLIIDLRCYPSDFMPFTIGAYIKSIKSPFVKFTIPTLGRPGNFVVDTVLSNGADNENNFKGKVILLVNEITQSQGEYTTMALQSSSNVTVIGSQTAGADGNVSNVVLPGGLFTRISGLGIYYPNGSETQRVGVKIDHIVKPSIAGIKAGKDELLEFAIKKIKEETTSLK